MGRESDLKRRRGEDKKHRSLDDSSPRRQRNRDSDVDRNSKRSQWEKDKSRSPRPRKSEQQDVKPFDRDTNRRTICQDSRETSLFSTKDKMENGVKREWKSPKMGKDGFVSKKWGQSSSKLKNEGDEMWGKPGYREDKESKKVEREKPSFEPSGKLAADTNTYKGVVIKYNEPPEAKIPKIRWRLYPFKGEESMPVIYVHRQSAYLIGRDRKIADFPIDHPSCSKQHAALQYRSMPYVRSDGTSSRRTRPYIIDLKSANGTYLNGQRIEAQRYIELQEKDVLKFGFSTREFVVLNENSLDAENESDGDEEKGADIDIAGAEEKLNEDDGMF